MDAREIYQRRRKQLFNALESFRTKNGLSASEMVGIMAEYAVEILGESISE